MLQRIRLLPDDLFLKTVDHNSSALKTHLQNMSFNPAAEIKHFISCAVSLTLLPRVSYINTLIFRLVHISPSPSRTQHITSLHHCHCHRYQYHSYHHYRRHQLYGCTYHYHPFIHDDHIFTLTCLRSEQETDKCH